MTDYEIRPACEADIPQLASVEAACFPAAEAAGEEALRQRVLAFPESFFVAEAGGQIIGFINGAVTDERTIRDEMFADSSLHDPDGGYQSVFGLDVLQPYRRRGIGAALMERLIQAAREQGRKGVILTCKEEKIRYYETFGYQNQGVSDSVHGGAVWYDMVLEF